MRLFFDASHRGNCCVRRSRTVRAYLISDQFGLNRGKNFACKVSSWPPILCSIKQYARVQDRVSCVCTGAGGKEGRRAAIAPENPGLVTSNTPVKVRNEGLLSAVNRSSISNDYRTQPRQKRTVIECYSTEKDERKMKTAAGTAVNCSHTKPQVTAPTQLTKAVRNQI